MKKSAMSFAALLALFCLSFALGCQQQKGASSEKDNSEQQRANDQQAAQPSQQQLTGDQQFMAEAAATGGAEVELGRMAETKASNPAVKRFAQKLVDDHTKANHELESLPQGSEVLRSASLPEDKKSAIAELSQLSGKEFDRAFLDRVVQEHEAAISRFQEAAASAQDPQVKQFAAEKLSGLKRHLEMAKSLLAQASGGRGGERSRQ